MSKKKIVTLCAFFMKFMLPRYETILILPLVICNICISCNSKLENFSYDIPVVNAEQIQEIVDSSSCRYSVFCTYSKYCDFCQQDFPNVFQYCTTLPVDFYILFHVRERDSLYIYSSMKEIQKLDSSFNNFVVLSDSLYDEPYRNMSNKKGIFVIYGGPIEGNKYINFCDNYIPEGFNRDCITPKLIMYEKNKGIVFVNEYDSIYDTCLSNKQKMILDSITACVNILD